MEGDLSYLSLSDSFCPVTKNEVAIEVNLLSLGVDLEDVLAL